MELIASLAYFIQNPKESPEYINRIVRKLNKDTVTILNQEIQKDSPPK